MKVFHLNFADLNLTALEVGNKHFRIFKRAEKLEHILIEKGAEFKELKTEQTTTDPEEEEVFLDGTWLRWDFEENFKLRIIRYSSHRNDSTIVWWNLFFGPNGKKYVIDGNDNPIFKPVQINKVYEGDDVPSKDVLRKVTIEKPSPNWVIAILVLLIFFFAAIIFA